MTAICKICKQEIQSMIVGDDKQKTEEAMAICILNHMGQQHIDYMSKLVGLNKMFSGFIVMNRFAIANEEMEEEKETMREELLNRLYQDAPYSDDDENEDEDDDDDEDEIEETKSEISQSVESNRKRGEPQEIKRRKKRF